MTWSFLRSRIRASLVGVAAGWLAVMIVTLPMQLLKIYSGNVGTTGTLLWSFAAGEAVWALWVAAFVALGWLCAVLPLIAFVPEKWMLDHPRWSIAICGALGWSVLLVEFKVWKLTKPEHSLDVRMFTLYSLMLVVFPAVAAAVYLRRIARLSSER